MSPRYVISAASQFTRYQASTVIQRSRLVQFSSKRCLATRKYTPDHEWVSISSDIATVGITDYAQKALGDVVYVELPAVGKSYEAKEQMGAVESVKAASDIYSPVTGEIVEVNKNLEKEPTLLNHSPYEKGWIAKIKVRQPEEFDGLMDEKGYIAHCEEAH
ncbi:hypothetical protein SeMB42_g00121 [Synchytrium endobioticum]|uniref:Glycine cleavage system H protein n=1 Tax=Synchytrium endobioticum TaxID=286115 RepID=A0A507DL38_9FUNG|nr:hypothetical protein SeLEV6574_g00215 [Synchytrium endobioticum]TPX54899.1 hypothetical protein SeMB42_g00121 [Synchytrium endobioticum]